MLIFITIFITWFVLVINGEKATLETPTFAQKRRRTLDMLIRSLYQDLMPDVHKVTGSTGPSPPAESEWRTRAPASRPG